MPRPRPSPELERAALASLRWIQERGDAHVLEAAERVARVPWVRRAIEQAEQADIRSLGVYALTGPHPDVRWPCAAFVLRRWSTSSRVPDRDLLIFVYRDAGGMPAVIALPDRSSVPDSVPRWPGRRGTEDRRGSRR